MRFDRERRKRNCPGKKQMEISSFRERNDYGTKERYAAGYPVHRWYHPDRLDFDRN